MSESGIVGAAGALTIHEVRYASQADLKVYRVRYAAQADIRVFEVDYVSQAGWNGPPRGRETR
ncbi:MAG: hypothetical protein WCZ65_07415 [Lysobacteraceae bacterium]